MADIITIQDRDNQKVTSIKNELYEKGNNFLNKTYNISIKKIIIFLFCILIICYIISLIYKESDSNNNNNIKIKKNNNNIIEGYKTNQVRDDNYNDFDVKTAIYDLIEKQENYLSKKIHI